MGASQTHAHAPTTSRCLIEKGENTLEKEEEKEKEYKTLPSMILPRAAMLIMRHIHNCRCRTLPVHLPSSISCPPPGKEMDLCISGSEIVKLMLHVGDGLMLRRDGTRGLNGTNLWGVGLYPTSAHFLLLPKSLPHCRNY